MGMVVFACALAIPVHGLWVAFKLFMGLTFICQFVVLYSFESELRTNWRDVRNDLLGWARRKE